jgi:hypothetical protein
VSVDFCPTCEARLLADAVLPVQIGLFGFVRAVNPGTP